MLTFFLNRFTSKEYGTFGVLRDEKGDPFLTTLERPWLDNKADISCIPVGTYDVKRTTTPEHGECFELQNVPGRGAILIHAGNTIKDSKGCILLGKEYGKMYDGTPAILLSQEAVKVFMSRLFGQDQFLLKIWEVT